MPSPELKVGDAMGADYFANAPSYATHEVLNQAGALADYDAYADNKPLVQAMKVFGADWADEVLLMDLHGCRVGP
jgi:hypothetical protein